MRKVIILERDPHAGGFIDAILSSGDALLGFLDDNTEQEPLLGFNVIGNLPEYVNYPDAEFIIGSGDPKRREMISLMCSGAKWYTAIHPESYISRLGVDIGEGSLIMPGAIINPGAQIGRHTIINSTVVIDLDNTVGNFCHVAVGAKFAGHVSIGNRTWIGIGAVISNNVSICEDCLIGAGAVVVKSITEPGVYVGSPAKKIR